MKNTTELSTFVHEALNYVRQAPDVLDAELFASSNNRFIGRVDFKSDIPSAGLQEPKSMADFGFGMQVVFGNGDGDGDGQVGRRGGHVGFASLAGDLTLEAVAETLDKARANAVHDPDFVSLPHPSTDRPYLEDYADRHVCELSESEFVRLGYEALSGALEVYNFSGRTESVVVGGDVTILHERIAVANTRGIDESDETTACLAGITSMIESANVKGSGWASATHLSQFSPKAAGAEAAHHAISTVGGKRLGAGRYTVLFGPQPMADFMEHLVIPSLKLSTMDAHASAWSGKLGQRIAWDHLTVYDDGSIPELVGSKRVTCEGLPTGRTDLISNGVLVGFLSNTYYANKCSDKFRRYRARSGFRFSGLGRQFDRTPGIAATNVVVQGRYEKTYDEIERDIEDGLYIGRIWYTYPVNGQAAGDFTCTVIGDSYIIKNGRRVGTIKPNTLRINDNIKRVLQETFAISNQRRPLLGWASEEVVFTPCVAVRGVNIEPIASFMEV